MYKLRNWRMYHPTSDAGGATDAPAPNSTVADVDAPPADMQSDPPNAADNVNATAEKMANAIVAKKLKGMPSKEELTAFRAWQESQKTPEQKESEEITRLRNEAAENAAKVQAYERKDAVLVAGVSPAYAEYVAFEAGKLVTDGTDFKTALGSFIKANPQFKGQPTPQNTQLPLGGSARQMDGVEKAFLKLNPDLKE